MTSQTPRFEKQIRVSEITASGNISEFNYFSFGTSGKHRSIKTFKFLANACLNQDPRIHYCVPFCGNDTLQLAMIDAALKSHGRPDFAAIMTHGFFNDQQNWAFTVLNVNLNANPEAHLVVGTFLDPAWCAVYIGMQTTGDPYLYEMQAGIVLH